MISAMLHNVATFRANNVRVSAVFAAIDPDQASRAMLEVDSTRSYDYGIGTASLGLFVPLMRAQLLTVLGRFEEALALFDGHIDLAPSQGMSRLLPSYLADVAWCSLSVGKENDARAAVQRALSCSTEESDPDDLATAYARISKVLFALGDPQAAEKYDRASIESLTRHHEAQAELLRLLEQEVNHQRTAE
jgi:tetratricopeptide (TPR) repeat protein